MAQAELLLLTPVEHLGNEGDTVKVKSGYARNYLLPRGLAIPMTRANRKQMEVLKLRAEQRLADELSKAQALKERIAAISIAFAVKTGPGGKMFGSVTTQDLISRLAEEGIQLDRKQVNMTPVKNIGQHSADIRLHEQVELEYAFDVVSENPIEEEAEATANS
jgi:large subunit ribosomal protein L9